MKLNRTLAALALSVMLVLPTAIQFKAYDDVQLERTKIIIKESYSKLGCPYVWGANAEDKFDCSSLVQYTFKKANISLPRTSAMQAQCGEVVPPNEMRAGDLMFFDTRKGVSTPTTTTHVGIYLGKDYIIHASSVSGEVVIEQLSTSGMVPLLTTIRRMY